MDVMGWGTGYPGTKGQKSPFSFMGQFGQSFGGLPAYLQQFLEDPSGGAGGLFQSTLGSQFGGSQTPGARFFGPQFGTFFGQYLSQLVNSLISGQSPPAWSDFITGQNFGSQFQSYSPRMRGENPAAFSPLTQKLR